MKKIGLSLVLIFILLMLPGCSKTPVITGTIIYTEEIALPAEAVNLIF